MRVRVGGVGRLELNRLAGLALEPRLAPEERDAVRLAARALLEDASVAALGQARLPGLREVDRVDLLQTDDVGLQSEHGADEAREARVRLERRRWAVPVEQLAMQRQVGRCQTVEARKAQRRS